MKKFLWVVIFINIFISCSNERLEYPDVTVKDIIQKVDWNGNFEKTEKFFENEFKLKYVTSKFNETGGATAYEFSGGKLFGKKTENWIAGFLHDKLNAIIIKFESPRDPERFYGEICEKINGDIGKNTMEMEKSTFWNFELTQNNKLFSVVCNITPNTNDILVVIKKIR